MTSNLSDRSNGSRRWVGLVLRFVLIAVALWPVLMVASCFVIIASRQPEKREPGFGKQEQSYPVVVLVPRREAQGHEARLVKLQNLRPILEGDPRATLLVPRAEEADILEQIRRLSDKDYFESSIDIEHLPDGRQRMHVVATQSDDFPDESWYVASAREFVPEFRLQYDSHSRGAATALLSGIIAFLLSPLVALLIVWRMAKGRAEP